ncbi:di-trans,poly-cis-decaprenylcistransferase [Candidatus Collierbacteria bacterium]|nr:di-trans,poly-cis-decaprenylcistransferase [Candidatus Collierbacteria bacterium]
MKKGPNSSFHSVFSIQNSEFRRRLPAHVAIIMDGNRRWATSRGLAAVMGHDKAARDVIEPIIDRAIQLGIKFLTFWAFSTENWKRDQAEIKALMGIFREGLKKFGSRLNEKGIKLNIVGEMNKFPEDIRKQSEHYMEISRNNKKITVSFALNYGGRDEILRAIRKLIANVQRSTFNVQDLSEETFGQFLDTAGIPDPDLIIRTGGDLRLSGYFPWQSVYSELYFTKTLWPDFTPKELDKALKDYAGRERRFGGNKK